jgi:predicted amidophosphoribosyltransferase
MKKEKWKEDIIKKSFCPSCKIQLELIDALCEVIENKCLIIGNSFCPICSEKFQIIFNGKHLNG